MIEQGPRGQINPDRLTIWPAPPKLEVGRNIIMPEGGEGPKPPVNPAEKLAAAVVATRLAVKPEAHRDGVDVPKQKIKLSPEEARNAWVRFYGKDLATLPYEEQQAINAAISLGYGPSSRAGKGQEGPEVSVVVKNSMLSEDARIDEAERLLELSKGTLSKDNPQRQALLDAHEFGAGIFRNSPEQLLRKARILSKAGYSKEQIHKLIKEGLVAAPIPPADYLDPILQNIVTELNAEIIRNGVGNPLEQDYIREQRVRVRSLLDQGRVDEAQANNLVAQLSSWMAETETAMGQARARQEDKLGRYTTSDAEIKIRTDEVERERIFEEIFVGVDANPGSAFQASLSLDASTRLDEFFTILNHAEVYDSVTGENITNNPDRIAEVAKRKEELVQEFSGRRQVRQILHDANYSVAKGGGDIQEFARSMSTFQSEYIDLIFQDPLVATALRMFEQAFQQIKADNHGMLPYEELAWNYKTKSSNLEDKVWTLMRREMQLGLAPENIPEWRLRRAIILARGFGVASLRFPEIAAQARLPEETPLASSTDKASRFGSIYGEAIARYLDPLEHIIEKFAIGDEDRALLYYFLTGDEMHTQSKEQLTKALEMASHLVGKDKRLIDIVNIFRIGGGFSQSSWRTFMSMRDFTPEQRRRAGIGILEGRVSGDADDAILAKVMGEPRFAAPVAGETAEQKEVREEKIAKEAKRLRDSDYKKEVIRNKRLAMWKDALEANPLRVMWQWEEKEPGKRMAFLNQALGSAVPAPGETLAQAELKRLAQVEQDLIILQENTVRRLNVPEFLADGVTPNPDHISYSAPEFLPDGITPNPAYIPYDDPAHPEMLDYNLIVDATRRNDAIAYVNEIRANARTDGYKFIKSLFDKDSITSVEKSPFPFVIGFEDIPFSDFNFINTGGRGFARRINDYANSVNASNELMNLIGEIPKAHNIKPLIDSLAKIKHFVEQYDKAIAMDVVPYLARGIIRMYDKGLDARMPLGIGTVMGMVSDSSFAQKEFGRDAMTWDEGDKFNFTRQLLHNGLIRKKDLAGLRADVGATPVNVAVDVLRTYGQMALLMLLYSFAKTVASDKK